MMDSSPRQRLKNLTKMTSLSTARMKVCLSLYLLAS